MSVFAMFHAKASRLQRAAPGTRALELYLLLAVLWAILFFSMLTGHRLIPYDSIEQYYPAVYFNAQSLRHGEWAWWNPHVYWGYPQIADPQGMMFSPLLVLLMMLRENPGVVWFDFCVLLHVLIGGEGFLFLCRVYRFTPAASVLAALVYMVGGVASARLQHMPMVLAYACFPWVLHCCHRFTEAPTYRMAVALGISSGLLFTHLVQPTYLFMPFALLYCVTRLVDTRSTITRIAIVRLIGGIGIAAASCSSTRPTAPRR
jgi:hypothetical protein